MTDPSATSTMSHQAPVYSETPIPVVTATSISSPTPAAVPSMPSTAAATPPQAPVSSIPRGGASASSTASVKSAPIGSPMTAPTTTTAPEPSAGVGGIEQGGGTTAAPSAGAGKEESVGEQEDEQQHQQDRGGHGSNMLVVVDMETNQPLDERGEDEEQEEEEEEEQYQRRRPMSWIEAMLGGGDEEEEEDETGEGMETGGVEEDELSELVREHLRRMSSAREGKISIPRQMRREGPHAPARMEKIDELYALLEEGMERRPRRTAPARSAVQQQPHRGSGRTTRVPQQPQYPARAGGRAEQTPSLASMSRDERLHWYGQLPELAEGLDEDSAAPRTRRRPQQPSSTSVSTSQSTAGGRMKPSSAATASTVAGVAAPPSATVGLLQQSGTASAGEASIPLASEEAGGSAAAAPAQASTVTPGVVEIGFPTTGAAGSAAYPMFVLPSPEDEELENGWTQVDKRARAEQRGKPPGFLARSPRKTKPGMLSTVPETTQFWPPTDYVETKDELIILMELPGLSSDDFTIEICDDGAAVRVSGNRKSEVARGDVKASYLTERELGKFCREFEVPVAVDFNQCSARLTRGVLEVSFPKQVPKKIQVQS